MLKVGQKREAVRIVLLEALGDEPEAFVLLAPISPAMRRRAQRIARQLMGETEVADLDLDKLIDIGELASRELIRLGLVEWGGIGDDDGNPLELTPDRETRFATAASDQRPTGSIDALLDDEDVVAIIDSQYVRPDAIRRAEKNGLSASPNGIGGAETPGKDTANSPARKKRAGGARSVPIAKTRSKPRRPKTSG